MNKLLILLTVLLVPWLTVNVSAQDEHDHDHASNQVMHEEHADSEDHDDSDDHVDHDEHETGFVQLTEAELAEFGVALETAGPGLIRNDIVVPGEIAVNGDRIANIVPRFTGVVKQVFKRIGDRVRAGDVLAVVESNEGLSTYDVTALMDGTVIDKQINIGDVHQGDGPAFIIADLNTVWVNLSVFQMHAPAVQTGQLAAITSDHGINYEDGEIFYLSPVVDEHTRTTTARVVLDNRTGKWRPGSLIEGRIATDSYQAKIVIPKTAIFNMDGANVVFVLSTEGFKAQPIQIGRTNHVNVEVISGMEVGQIYASSGGFTIKAEIQKGSFGDGHAH